MRTFYGQSVAGAEPGGSGQRATERCGGRETLFPGQQVATGKHLAQGTEEMPFP